MALGFAAHFVESRTLQIPQADLFKRAKSALQDLGWPYVEIWGHELRVRIPHGYWSWGEIMTVKILPGGAIQAESTCIALSLC